MKSFLAILMLLMSPSFAAEKYLGWPKVIQDIPYDSDASIKIDGFFIKYFIPVDPEIQQAGGSGGPIGQIDITDLKAKKTISFDFQTVGARILEPYNKFPQFEIWSRAGGGSWCRSLYRFQKGKFQDIRIDDFTEFPFRATDKSITTTLTRSDDTLYYVGTRYPDEN